MNTEPNQSLELDQEQSGGELLPALVRFLRVLRLRKHIVLSSVYLCVLAGGVYYYLAPRYYQSSANILVVDQNKDQLSVMGTQDATGNTMATHRELVVSPVVIKRAIQQLGPRDRVDLEGVPPNKWIERIQDRLGASVKRKTNIIDVSYQSRNPESAAAIVRSVINAYLDFVAENHEGTMAEFTASLTEEKEKIEADLLAKQEALHRKRQSVGHLAASSEDQIVEPTIQRALKLNEALAEAQQKRLILVATVSSMEQAARNGENVAQQLMGLESVLGQQVLMASLGMSPEDMRVVGEQKKKLLASQQEMQNLTNIYGPNHPRMNELRQEIEMLQKFIVARGASLQNGNKAGLSNQVVQNLLVQSLAQATRVERQLAESYEAARSEAARQSGDLVQMHMLERDVARKEALYDTLINSLKEINLSQIHAPIKATVTREPLPSDRPVTPRLPFVSILSVLGGLIAGCMIVYVQDILDDRFTSPEEMSAQLNVPILSIIKKLDPLPGAGLDSVYTFSLPNSVESEAFRTLRTTLNLSGDVCDRILISSSEPSDGKTTISANLAVALAQSGNRTLVIDADLRKPGFSTLMGLKGQQGVADLLASEHSPEELAPQLLHHTDQSGLDILPVGLRRPNPAELLSGKAFVELLAWADSQYDRVLVDCPPVLAVSDAQIVGQLVDGAVLVVRPDKNHRRSVIRAVESFQETGCRVLGVVANAVSNDSGQYGYGYGYGYGYTDGYGHDVPEEHEDSTDANQYVFDYESHRKSPAATENNPAEPPPAIRPRRAA